MPGERFSVRLVPEEGGPSDRVVVEVGMDGFNVLNSDGSRVLRKYPLPHISRWSSRGSSLVLFTRSPVDVEDRSMTLQGDEYTIRSVLDTLTSCCMQMAELLQSGQGGDRNAANSLSALLKKNKKAAELPTADQVEFWRSPEKAGWMHSQGEHIKTWRKRWFILKQGFLFRFSSAEVGPSTKPNGVVDLSQVTDVSDGSSTTGRPNSIKLSTATGSKCYITDSETAMVEWISALENSVARIVKIIAGVDEEDHSPGVAASKALAEQFRSYSSKSSGPRGEPSRSHSHGKSHHSSGNGPQMVNVVNYGGVGGGGGGSGAGPSAPSRPSGGLEYGYVNIDYGGLSGTGFQVAPSEAERPAAGGGGSMYGNIYSPPAGAGGGMDAGYGGQSGGYGAPASVPAMPQYQQQPVQDPYQQQHYQPQQQGYAAAAAPAGDYNYSAAPQQSQPQQQGSTLMDAVTTPAGPPAPQNSSPWQIHYTADGRPYYYNLQTQITQWEAPAA